MSAVACSDPHPFGNRDYSDEAIEFALEQQRQAEEHWETVVVPRDWQCTAREVRARYEDEYPSALMEWVDLVWDDTYYEGRGLEGDSQSGSVHCEDYMLQFNRAEGGYWLREPGYGGHCNGLDGPEFVWCLLDDRFAVEQRIPDLRFEDWKAFMDYQCRLASPVSEEPARG